MKKLLLIYSTFFIIQSISGQNWEYVGNCCIDAPVAPLASSGSEDLDYTDDGTPVVLYFSQTGGTTSATCKKFENDSWQMLGDNIPVTGTIQGIDLEVFGTSIYAAVLTGSSTISVWEFADNSWNQLGSDVSGNLAFNFIHDNNGDLFLFVASSFQILKYNGTEWIEIYSQLPSTYVNWGGDKSIVCDGSNNFYYNEATLTPNFSFSTQMMKFDGSTSTPFGDVVYYGGGTNGKVAIDEEGHFYNQYTYNNTTKIVKLVNNEWQHQIDTTNVLNTFFGFNYAFDANNTLILQSGMNLYYGADYSPLPAIVANNLAISINELLLFPDGKLYVSFGEFATGSGSDFSVMRFNDGNYISFAEPDELLLFPNPAKDFVNISAPAIIRNVAIYDLQGKLQSEVKQLNQNYLKLNISELPMGYYILQISTESNILSTKLIVL